MARTVKKRLPKLTIFDAALEFGVDRNFLTRELKRTFPNGKQSFTVQEVHQALSSDIQKEKARAQKARSDMLVLEYEEAAGKVMEVGEFRDGLEDFVAVTNSEIASLDAPEDFKRTIVRALSGVKKNWDARIKDVLQRFPNALNGSSLNGA
jgi:hypothetical protein